MIRSIAECYREHMVRTNILSASLREVSQVSQSFTCGAEVCTMPVKVFDKMYDHVLTEKGLELFQKDWDSINGTV